MSPTRTRDRLLSLLATIRSLTPIVLEQEREAFNGCDLLVIERAAFTRASLDIAKETFIAEAAVFLGGCPYHIEGSLIAGCPDCLVAADVRGGPAVPQEIRDAVGASR